MKTHYRNKKILQFAKGQPCQHCGTSDGTIVAAHSNLMRDGKGIGIKSDDCYVSYLCYHCHASYDHHELTQEDFDRAMKRTMKLWLVMFDL
jgi:hypothetical protein